MVVAGRDVHGHGLDEEEKHGEDRREEKAVLLLLLVDEDCAGGGATLCGHGDEAEGIRVVEGGGLT